MPITPNALPASGNVGHRAATQSNAISAIVTVPQLVITQNQTIFVGGIPVGTTITVVCRRALAMVAEGWRGFD